MIETSIIILTYNAEKYIQRLLDMVSRQNYNSEYEIIVIDSGSVDGTLQILKEYQINPIQIKQEEFGHGKTRNLGARIAKGEYIVFLSHDAIPVDENWLHNLIKPLRDNINVSGAFGRQIAEDFVKPMERFFLLEQYPTREMIDSNDAVQKGYKEYFFSDANAVLRKNRWKEAPYTEVNVIGEDYDWCKRQKKMGREIIYIPEAAVYHSHNYNLRTNFHKFFDTGAFLWWVYDGENYSTFDFMKQGVDYTLKEFKYLIFNGYILWIPYAIAYDFLKFVGTFFGKNHRHLPLWFNRICSRHKNQWIKPIDKN